MSAETGILAILVKYLWVGFTAVFGFLFAWAFRRLNNTYTKQETDERIDSNVEKVLLTVRWHGEQIKRQNELLEKVIDKVNQDSVGNARLEQKLEALVDRIDRREG